MITCMNMRGDGGDEDEYEEEDGTSVGQEESCHGVIEKIKDGGVKTFSFIAAEGGWSISTVVKHWSLLFFQ